MADAKCQGCDAAGDEVGTETALYDALFEAGKPPVRVRYCPECYAAAEGKLEGSPWSGQPALSIAPAGEPLPLFTPTGVAIQGTYEMIPGRCDVAGFVRDADGRFTPELSGDGTDIFWDGQETVDRPGGIVVLATDGLEWLLRDDGSVVALEREPLPTVTVLAGEVKLTAVGMVKVLRDAAVNTPALSSSREWTKLIEQADEILARAEERSR